MGLNVSKSYKARLGVACKILHCLYAFDSGLAGYEIMFYIPYFSREKLFMGAYNAFCR